MKIIVTGCAGFIGSHATRLLVDKGHQVFGIDALTYAANLNNIEDVLSKIQFKQVNICDYDNVLKICEQFKPDWIMNFAAETHVDNSIENSSEFVKTNVVGVHCLLDVCNKLNIKLFHVSTDEVYGSTQEGSFVETDKLSPRNPYSATKAAAEHLIKSYHITHGLDYIMVRPSNNFGPCQHGEKFLPTIIRSLSNGRKIPIYGAGINVRDWLYVKDNVAMMEKMISSGKLNEVYNISCKKEMTNIDLVTTVLKNFSLDFDSSVEFVKDRAGHDLRYSICNKKIKSSDLYIETNFEDSLGSTIEWYRKNMVNLHE